jgi:nucleoside-diphosphate-sugar epimerase
LTVVVTGSSGFIGSHLCSALLARSEEVVGIDRTPSSLVPTIRTDLAAPSDEALDALSGAGVVWHLAACPGIRDRSPDIESRRRRDNVVAAAAVLDAVPLRTPLIVTSSSSVYGGSRLQNGAERPSREDDPLRPRGGYARSKVAMERLCRRRAARGGRVSIARPFTVAGERQRSDMAIATWIEAIRSDEVVSMLGSPDRTRDVTDVRDVVRGLIAMAEREIPGVLNLGSGAAYSLAEIVRAVSGALGLPAFIQVVPAPSDEVPATRADTTRCRQLLGITFETDLRAIVERQVAATEVAALSGLQEVG